MTRGRSQRHKKKVGRIPFTIIIASSDSWLSLYCHDYSRMLSDRMWAVGTWTGIDWNPGFCGPCK